VLSPEPLRPSLRTAGAALALVALSAAPASAATVKTPNACQYSYDNLWRDLDLTLQGVVDVPGARAGQTITASSQAFDVDLPGWLAQTGYNFGLFRSGLNEIPVSVWIAIRGTNTVEGVQWQRIDGVAETEITTLGDGTFVSATPITYSVAPLTATTWTAKGGDVQLAQAPSGALDAAVPGGIPVGPNGALRRPKGSVVILASLGEEVRLAFDCLPGRFAGGGDAYLEAPASPYARTTVPTYECLSAVPAATNVAGVDVGVTAAPGLAGATSGQPFDLAARVHYTLPQAYLQELRAAGRLAEGENALAGTFTVALDGAATDPARRTATVTLPAGTIVTVPPGGGAITVSGSGAADAVEGTLELPATRWSPTSAATMRFSAGSAGALGELADVAGVAGAVRPYGGVFGRLSITPSGAAARHLSLDCVAGRVDVSDPGRAYGERGNGPEGDAGRYAVSTFAPDPFAAVAVAVPAPGPTLPPAPEPAPATPAPVPAPPGSPAPAPTPGGTPAAPGPRTTLQVRSTTLRATRGRVPVTLRCVGTIGVCRGSIALRTTAKVALGGRRRVVTVTRSASYRLEPGTTKVVRLAVGRDGAAVLRRTRTVRVTAVARPTGSKSAITRRLALRR